MISTQPSTGDNYVRIDNIQICWGDGSVVNSSVTILTFPMSFIQSPYVTAAVFAGSSAQPPSVSEIQINSATFITLSSVSLDFHYHAIGEWK